MASRSPVACVQKLGCAQMGSGPQRCSLLAFSSLLRRARDDGHHGHHWHHWHPLAPTGSNWHHLAALLLSLFPLIDKRQRTDDLPAFQILPTFRSFPCYFAFPRPKPLALHSGPLASALKYQPTSAGLQRFCSAAQTRFIRKSPHPHTTPTHFLNTCTCSMAHSLLLKTIIHHTPT